MKVTTIAGRLPLLLLGLAAAAALVLIALVPYVAQGTGTGPKFHQPLAINV